jgi:hypothetical protein
MKRTEHYTFGKASKRLIPQKYDVFKLKGRRQTFIVSHIIRKVQGSIFYLRELENEELTCNCFQTTIYFFMDIMEPIINRVSFYK